MCAWGMLYDGPFDSRIAWQKPSPDLDNEVKHKNCKMSECSNYTISQPVEESTCLLMLFLGSCSDRIAGKFQPVTYRLHEVASFNR